MLTCPKVMRLADRLERQRKTERDRVRRTTASSPSGAISGDTNHQTSRAVVATVASDAITTTSGNGRNTIGAMSRPANGG